MLKRPYISFVIPARDEEKSVEILYGEILEVISKIKKSYEIIFIDDVTKDKTFENLKKIKDRNKDVIKIIKLRGNWGKSIALQTGFDVATGEVIITMDADLQDNPYDIPKFLEKINQGADFVSGWKKKRYDPPTKVVSSRVFNMVVSILSGVKIHDVNCGFKAFKREVIKNINLYGELYRFLPIMVASQNYRVEEIVVKHRRRRFGKSKFGWKRTIKGALDLLTVVFLTGYLRRPGHFFGILGFVSFLFGFAIGLYITYLRITTGSIQFRHPLLFLGILFMIIGIQLVTTGLLGEMIASYNQKHPDKDLSEERIL